MTIKTIRPSSVADLALAARLPSRADMAQRNIEILIGRLVTDEAFRAMFIRNPAATLAQFVEWGYELTPLEIAAVRATDPRLWSRTADQIDPRLQKMALGLS